MAPKDQWLGAPSSGRQSGTISPAGSSERCCTPPGDTSPEAEYDRMCEDLDPTALVSGVPQPGSDAPCWSIARARGERPNESCCMTAVRYGGSIIYFGGGIVRHIFADLYEYKVQSQVWAKLQPLNHEQVTPVLSHTATVYENYMFVFAGMTEGRCINTIHRLDLDAMAWTVLDDQGANPPCPRKGHTAVTYGSAMYVLMGAVYTGGILDDLHKFDIPTGQWHQVEQGSNPDDQRPPALTGHSAAVHNDTMMVFGGMTHPHGEEELGCEWTNNLYAYHFHTQKWREVMCSSGPQASMGSSITPPLIPPGRYSHVSWVDGENFYIFGGDTRNCSIYFNDVWTFNVREGRWRRIVTNGNIPAPRSGLCAVAFRGMVLLFGGERPPRAEVEAILEATSATLRGGQGPSPAPAPLGAPTASHTSPQPDLFNFLPHIPPPEIELRSASEEEEEEGDGEGGEMEVETEIAGGCGGCEDPSDHFMMSPETPITSAPSASLSLPASSEHSGFYSPSDYGSPLLHSVAFAPPFSEPAAVFVTPPSPVQHEPEGSEGAPSSVQLVSVSSGNGGGTWGTQSGGALEEHSWEWASNLTAASSEGQGSGTLEVADDDDDMDEQWQGESNPIPIEELVHHSNVSPEAPVEYSNNVFQLPLFVDAETSLQELAARHLVRYNPYNAIRPGEGLPQSLKQEVRLITPVVCTPERAAAAHIRRAKREGSA